MQVERHGEIVNNGVQVEIMAKHIYHGVWLRKRAISAGLEPLLSNTEKSCMAS